MKIPIVIVKLLFLGALFIVSNHELHLADEHERGVFFDLYYGWVDSLVNQGFEVTGYVVKFEWLPDKEQDISGKLPDK
ncbi:MAG: hypothetical protein CL811_12470 [Colwelliaceae bacterium]|jgi:hypothetical protein|nr:hypothetical protein [Colwelliaceae bacterium]